MYVNHIKNNLKIKRRITIILWYLCHLGHIFFYFSFNGRASPTFWIFEIKIKVPILIRIFIFPLDSNFLPLEKKIRLDVIRAAR